MTAPMAQTAPPTGPAATPFLPAFEGVVRITRIGTAYLVFTLVIGFAALNTGNNSLYIALAFMLGGLLASGAASRGGLQRFNLALEIDGEVWADRPAEALLRMRNRSRIWNVRDVIVVSELMPEPLLVPLIPRGEALELRLALVFRRRGATRVSSVDLYTRYPFGLFIKKRRIALDSAVIVYPRLLPDTLEQTASSSGAVDVVPRRRPGSGAEIHGFRDYVRGDNLRHVHWKKSAAVGRWIMKQHEEESAPAVVVAIDPVKPAGASDEAFETMISAATTLLHDAIEDDLDVALILPATRIRGRGASVRRSVFETLALVEAERSGDFPVVPRGAVLFSLRSSHESKSA